jgi:hypothetical protein
MDAEELNPLYLFFAAKLKRLRLNTTDIRPFGRSGLLPFLCSVCALVSVSWL